MKLDRLKALSLALAITFAVPAFAARGGGESTANLHADKQFNIRVNPLGIAYGSLSAEMDYKLNEHWTIGPSLSHFSADFIFTSLSGWGIGARSNYYLTGEVFQDSWLIGATLGLSALNVTLGADSASSLGLFLQSTVGYQWVWKNGLNLQLGLGVAWYSNGSTTVADNGTTIDVPFYNGIKPAAEVTLGYLF